MLRLRWRRTCYLEGLKHDTGDIRINVAYGTLLLRRGGSPKRKRISARR